MVYPPVCAAEHRSARLRSGIVNSDVLTTRSSGAFLLDTQEKVHRCARQARAHIKLIAPSSLTRIPALRDVPTSV